MSKVKKEKNTESNILTRKIQIVPVGDKKEVDRVWNYIREGMETQNLAMNQYMSALYISELKKMAKEDRKELDYLFSRVSHSHKASAYSKDLKFPIGLPTAASLSRAVKQDFKQSCKDGLMYGKVSLPTYRKDNPLIIHVDFVKLQKFNQTRKSNANNHGMYHNYKDHMEFLDHAHSKDLDIFINFAHDITFKLVLGNPHKSRYLREELIQIFEEYYSIHGSSIEIKNKKMILNLSIEIPTQKVELDENTVVGVDLGIAIPAVCTLNNNIYKRYSIGNADDFINQRSKIQNERRRIQKGLASTSGGHGRTKKLRALERVKEKERRFVSNYCHYISKKVVDFAIQNHAKYINLENLTGYDTSQFLLANWSYYELQQDIIYKAAKYGIIVRFINPAYTSQVCSICGNWDKNQRISQSEFKCANPKCLSHSKYKTFNADFNASRNISISTLWPDGNELTDKDFREARKYYNIPEADEDLNGIA